MDPSEPQTGTSTTAPKASRWTFRIATVVGVPIRIHATFGLLLVWIVWVAGVGGRPVLMQLALVAGVFTCIVLHELGHVLVARRFGIGTRDITLYPIGGVSRLERMGEPREELPISLAGPAVSFALAVVLWAAVIALDRPVSWEALTSESPGYLELLAFINTILVIFNLMPAFPMDGGRILRASLALRIDRVTATRIAARIGRTFAVFFGVFGLLAGNLVLPIIAIFVFLGSKAEEQMQTVTAATRGNTVADAMITRFEVLAPDDALDVAAERLLRTDQADYPVLREGEVTGLLTRSRLLRALAGVRRETRVADVMIRAFPTVAPEDDLESVFQKLAQPPALPLLVMDDGKLVGIVTAENLSEFVLLAQVQARVEARGSAPRRRPTRRGPGTLPTSRPVPPTP